jgi:hypothetical protein
MIGPREMSELSLSQPAATGKMIAAAGKASAQKRLTLIIEDVSARMVFIFRIKSTNSVWIYTRSN